KGSKNASHGLLLYREQGRIQLLVLRIARCKRLNNLQMFIRISFFSSKLERIICPLKRLFTSIKIWKSIARNKLPSCLLSLVVAHDGDVLKSISPFSQGRSKERR